MMSRFLTYALGLLVAITSPQLAMSDPAKVGGSAPDFTLPNAQGAEVSLKSFAGKTVVLEWFNPGCPFVKKFYTNGDMQRFQRESVAKGVVWLTINSSAEGKQGHLTSAEALDVITELGLASTALLLDPNGTVGKLYGARTTPHMFVINPQGSLAYAGAVDSVASTRSNDIASATNYVLTAIDAISAGKNPAPSDTEPYGCGVKYAN
jgi:peroxiredoxin